MEKEIKELKALSPGLQFFPTDAPSVLFVSFYYSLLQSGTWEVGVNDLLDGWSPVAYGPRDYFFLEEGEILVLFKYANTGKSQFQLCDSKKTKHRKYG